MKHLYNLLIAIFLFGAVLPASAQTKEQADAAFSKKDYTKAVELYEALSKKGESEAVYYNLGNAYYRLNDYAPAVLNYQRALRLDPSDRDARFNLTLTQLKLKDQFTPQSEMFFVSFGRDLVNLQSIDAWAGWGIGFLALCLVLVLVFLFSSSALIRKISFFSALGFIVLAVAANTFAAIQKYQRDNEEKAVVMQPATLLSTPTSSPKTVMELHEGTTVVITDKTIVKWYQVQLPDGRVGWLGTNTVELVGK